MSSPENSLPSSPTIPEGESRLVRHEVVCPNIGPINVFVEGHRSPSEVVILTVHDLGCDHTMYRDFVEHPRMGPIRHRTVWVHVDVPGQGEGAPDLPADYHFPKMQEIGEDLVHVLDQLSIKEVVCFAEGAGANILVRFAMAHISRVLGICLIHTTGSAAGLLESLKDKVMKWKLDTFGMNHSAEQYLILHRFGSRFSQANDKDELKAIIEHYEDTLRHKINIRNLQMFVDVFLKRTSISDFIKALKCPVLLVTGQYSIFNVTTHYLHQVIVRTCEDKTKVELVEVAGVANVIEEKPDKLAECFQYFLQGLGLVSSVPMHNVHKMSRNRTMSMEDYDKPMKERTTSLSKSPPRDDHPMTPEHSPTGAACPLATE